MMVNRYPRSQTRIARTLVGVTALIASTAAPAAPDPLPLRFIPHNAHDVVFQPAGDGLYEIRTTGVDPYIFTETFPPVDLSTRPVLSFEYFSTTGTDHVQVYLRPGLSEARSVTGEGLAISEGWTTYAIDLAPALMKERVRGLRIDFGTRPNRTLQLRRLQLRAPTEQEFTIKARATELRELELERHRQMRGYLDRQFPHAVTRVEASEREISIQGRLHGSAKYLQLIEAPLWLDLPEVTQPLFARPIESGEDGRFVLAVERFVQEEGRVRDRVFSRWAVAQKQEDEYELVSHLRYADSVAPEWTLPEEKPRHWRGIGALGMNRPLSDLDDLDIAAATVNIVISSLFRTVPGPGRTPFEFAGRTWYAEDRAINNLDRTLKEAAGRGIIVSAIILVPQAGHARPGDYARLIAHPDAHPSGIYVMPHMNDRQGFEAYAAGLHFLARRYSDPENRFGRIHHWIMHNEIDMGWIWTNAGEKTALRYLDLYQKSMRTAHLIARQYNPHARTFISLTHHWNDDTGPRFYNSRTMLELLLEFCAVEGDFEWAIAHHPYPQDLRNPRTWEDTQAVFSFDTPKVTYRNIEVLDAWVRRPDTFYRGKHQRLVHLSEQGLNSPDYSETSLREQAAGMAYAWNKIRRLDSIEVFHYHNWVDNRHEGGLRLGLRRFPDDAEEPLGRKPIWHVYQALDTDGEDEATRFAKEVIGINDWDEIRHTGSIE